MTEKRFQLNKDFEWWFVKDNTIKVNEFGYRDDVIGEDKYRGLKQELTEEETVDLLNELSDENRQLKEENKQLLYKLQQIEEYLQIKIDECKNHKKMKEIVFGVEQQVGYEKALLGFQKGLKRRLNDE